MAEEAKDEIRTIPAAIKRVAIAVFAIYFTLPAVALVALPVTQQPDGAYTTLLGLTEEQGGYAGDPIAGVVANLNLGMFQTTSGDLRRHPGRHDPVPGHQRRADRRLAARLLDGHPPPAARPAAPAAPEVPHAVDRDPRLRRRRDHHHAARPGRLPGQPVRVRGDAVVHDRAPRGDPAADSQARRRAALPAAREHDASAAATSRSSRSSAGSGRSRRSSSPSACTWTSRPPASAGCRSASSSTSSTGAGRGWI